jgi:hypothetical protein
VIGESLSERRESERCERDETTRLAGATQKKKTTHSRRGRLKAGTLRLCTDFGQDNWPTKRNAKRSDNCQREWWKLKHTHFHDASQAGAEMLTPAAAKPAKKSKGASDTTTRSDI